MQTFLPYSDFEESASVLDRQRLGKQRVENLQIMKALLVPGSGWVNHPAACMWRGHEAALVYYHECIIFEWAGERGYKDTTLQSMWDLYHEHRPPQSTATMPWWMGMEEFHIAHQSNLIRKDRDWYFPIFGKVPDNLPYLWPDAEEDLH